MYAAFKRLTLPMGLTLDEVRISGLGAEASKDPFRIALEEPAQLEAELRQEDVQSFLTRTAPGGLQGFNVRMSEGKIFIEARMTVLIPVPVSAVCTLRIDEGKRLFVDLESVNVLGGAPKTLVQKQLDAINPVFDMSTLPVEGELTSVEVADGRALLKGTIRPLPPK